MDIDSTISRHDKGTGSYEANQPTRPLWPMRWRPDFTSGFMAVKHSVFNVKILVGTFNQEKTLVGACEIFANLCLTFVWSASGWWQFATKTQLLMTHFMDDPVGSHDHTLHLPAVFRDHLAGLCAGDKKSNKQSNEPFSSRHKTDDGSAAS